MIKKILGIFILLIIIIFFLYVVVDKILIKKTITNIEKLNLNIYLHEAYSFNIFPKLSLLTKFDLDKENLNLFIENAEFEIYKNYNQKPAAYF